MCEMSVLGCPAGIQVSYLVYSWICEPGIQGRCQLENINFGEVSVEMVLRDVSLKIFGVSGDREEVQGPRFGQTVVERAG